MFRTKPFQSLVCIAAIAAPAGFAQAQSTGTADRESKGRASSMIQEVLVTARKRGVAEAAQSVPVSLTALNGDQLEAMFAENLNDVSMILPNVRLDSDGAFPGTSNFAIRGMGFISTIASNDPTVGLFVDGQYIGVNLGGSPDTFDLESVEVLRGPQGTLFGRNVTAGAVVMRSRRPTGEFGTTFRIGAGSGGRAKIGGSVEGQLSDTFSGKIYAEYSDRDGDFDNLTTGGDHGANEVKFARPILRWQPSEDTDITLIGEFSDYDGDGVNARFIGFPGDLIWETFGAREPGDADELTLNYPGRTEIETDSLVLEGNWQVGNGTITSITGYRDVYYFSRGDTDSSGAPVVTDAWLDLDQDQFSQELRFASNAFDGRLEYTTGLYYFQQSMEQFYHVLFFGNPALRSRGTMDHESYSIFAQADYELVPDVYLTLGGRYTWEEKDAENASFSDCVSSGSDLTCDLSDSGSEDWANFSPKVGLSWQASRDVLLYASYTQGFRSGGYNIRTTADNDSPGPYDEEEVEAWEIGIKSTLLDGKARVNAAVFTNEYTDLQRTRSVGITNFIDNVAAATTEGAELEVTLLPTDNLALIASVGILNAEYDDYPVLDVDFDGTPDPELAKGLQLVKAPDLSYNLTGIYDLSLGDAGELSTRISYTYNDETPVNDQNTFFLDEWELLDASMTWRPGFASGVEVSLWGKNLTNETYAESGTYVHNLWSNLYQALPRRYGVELVYRY